MISVSYKVDYSLVFTGEALPWIPISVVGTAHLHGQGKWGEITLQTQPSPLAPSWHNPQIHTAQRDYTGKIGFKNLCQQSGKDVCQKQVMPIV